VGKWGLKNLIDGFMMCLCVRGLPLVAVASGKPLGRETSPGVFDVMEEN